MSDEFPVQDLAKYEEKPAQWKSVVSVLVIVVIGYFLFKMFLKLLIPIVCGILMIANRDIVIKVVREIYKLYKDETYKGLLATLAAIFLFLPFMVFLFGRTIYNSFIVDPRNPTEVEKEEDMTSRMIKIAVKEKVEKAKSYLEKDDDFNEKY